MERGSQGTPMDRMRVEVELVGPLRIAELRDEARRWRCAAAAAAARPGVGRVAVMLRWLLAGVGRPPSVQKPGHGRDQRVARTGGILGAAGFSATRFGWADCAVEAGAVPSAVFHGDRIGEALGGTGITGWHRR